MDARSSINNLSYDAYRNLWDEFWFQKLGRYPSSRIEKVVRKSSVEEAREKDEELEKEFMNFYNNKIANEPSVFRK